jgi:hypothetical protein
MWLAPNEVNLAKNLQKINPYSLNLRLLGLRKLVYIVSLILRQQMEHWIPETRPWRQRFVLDPSTVTPIGRAEHFQSMKYFV